MTQNNGQQTVLAGSGNRVAALLLDFILLIFMFGIFSDYSPTTRNFVLPLLTLAYFSVMPLTGLQGTLGKWVCRIKICDRRGNRLAWRASLIRALATISWFALPIVVDKTLSDVAMRHRLTELWWLLFLLPWFSIGFMPRRESFFDWLAKSIVVRYRATPEDIASVDPVLRRRGLNGFGSAILCLLVGGLLSMAMEVQRVKGMFSRIAYAIGETREIRKQIEQFHDGENRWPTSREISVPEWNPYPDGGGYRLQGNGMVVITFSVLPELKGHSITFAPKLAGNGQIDWQCSADPGIERRYLPISCR